MSTEQLFEVPYLIMYRQRPYFPVAIAYSPPILPARIWLVNAVLLAAFLAEAAVAKSRFAFVIGGWYGHMALTVFFVAILSIRGLSGHRTSSLVFSPPRSVTILLGMTLCWAVVCCAVQPNAMANLIYLVVFALNIHICLYVAPGLLLPSLGGASLLVYGLLLCLLNLLNLISALGMGSAFIEGRLRGVLANPLHAGTVSMISSILVLWVILQNRRRRWYLWVLWLVATCVLVMSRTRSYILGSAVGSLALVVTGLNQYPLLGRHARQLAFVFLLSVVVLANLGSYSPDILPQLREYFRVSGNAEEILRYRMVHWELGVMHAKTYPVFGRGPMAKFGNAIDPTVNTYDAMSCYVNTWLTMAQSYGIPGCVLFAASVLTMCVSSLRGHGTIPILAVGLLVAGIGSSFSTAWAASFGDVGDRAMWLILGLALAVPSSQEPAPRRALCCWGSSCLTGPLGRPSRASTHHISTSVEYANRYKDPGCVTMGKTTRLPAGQIDTDGK